MQKEDKSPETPFLIYEKEKAIRNPSSITKYYTDRDDEIKKWISNLSPEDDKILTDKATEFLHNLTIKAAERKTVTSKTMLFSVETAKILLVLIALHREIRIPEIQNANKKE